MDVQEWWCAGWVDAVVLGSVKGEGAGQGEVIKQRAALHALDRGEEWLVNGGGGGSEKSPIPKIQLISILYYNTVPYSKQNTHKLSSLMHGLIAHLNECNCTHVCHRNSHKI